MPQKHPESCLVSACLVGLCTRYDGRIKPEPACIRTINGMHWVPICPEQLGGLATPRTPADLIGGDGSDVLAGQAQVITREGVDVTRHFVNGARQCLEIARQQQIRTACLKSASPSCGLTPRLGVTAALLLQHNIRIIEF